MASFLSELSDLVTNVGTHVRAAGEATPRADGADDLSEEVRKQLGNSTELVKAAEEVTLPLTLNSKP